MPNNLLIELWPRHFKHGLWDRPPRRDAQSFANGPCCEMEVAQHRKVDGHRAIHGRGGGYKSTKLLLLPTAANCRRQRLLLMLLLLLLLCFLLLRQCIMFDFFAASAAELPASVSRVAINMADSRKLSGISTVILL